MAKRQHQARSSRNDSQSSAIGNQPSELRVIGGRFRGRKLRYHGDPVTRPMKHRVREAIFNLIGTEIKSHHAIDLFAGTGALGLEAISRGASGATLIEKHVPTARIVKENIAALELGQVCTLHTTSAFLWGKRDLVNAEFGLRSVELSTDQDSAFRNPHPAVPWLVFCSPPYSFYLDRQDDMLTLISQVARLAPAGSIVVVEADEQFDFNLLPGGNVGDKRTDGWQVRTYAPAVVGVWRK